MDKKLRLATNPNFRASKRPTVAIDRFQEDHILEAVYAVFMQHSLTSIDLEALVFLTMKHYGVEPSNFRDVYFKVKYTILKNYAIQQGDLIPPNERAVRRTVVVLTVERGKE